MLVFDGFSLVISCSFLLRFHHFSSLVVLAHLQLFCGSCWSLLAIVVIVVTISETSDHELFIISHLSSLRSNCDESAVSESGHNNDNNNNNNTNICITHSVSRQTESEAQAVVRWGG